MLVYYITKLSISNKIFKRLGLINVKNSLVDLDFFVFVDITFALFEFGWVACYILANSFSNFHAEKGLIANSFV